MSKKCVLTTWYKSWFLSGALRGKYSTEYTHISWCCITIDAELWFLPPFSASWSRQLELLVHEATLGSNIFLSPHVPMASHYITIVTWPLLLIHNTRVEYMYIASIFLSWEAHSFPFGPLFIIVKTLLPINECQPRSQYTRSKMAASLWHSCFRVAL